MLGRSDTAWYPTIRLFRQSRFGSWAEPFAAMAQQLHALLIPDTSSSSTSDD